MTLEAYRTAAQLAQEENATPQHQFAAAADLQRALREPVHDGPGLPPDATRLMLFLYEQAGAGGIGGAWTALADLYNNPASVPGLNQDLRRAMTFAHRGALTGDRDATIAFIEAVHFAPDELVDGMYGEAAAHLNALLAEDTDPHLLTLAAWMMAAGQGYAVDLKRARALLRKAAAAGDADAHFELYVFNRNGTGRKPDEASALRHLRAAAEAGHVRAMANLGGMYATGRGVPADDALAVHWYERAAEAGDLRSARNLAVMYATGHGAPHDPELSDRYRAVSATLAG